MTSATNPLNPVTIVNDSSLPIIATAGASTGTATSTSVNSSASSGQLLALNAARKGMTLVNTDANDLYLKYGTTATTAAGGWTYLVRAGATFEMTGTIYTGRIDGIWSAAGTGYAEITEF